MKCNKCGFENSLSNNFCGNCGNKLIIEPVICSNCGFKNENPSNYCGRCGQLLNSNIQQEKNHQYAFNEDTEDYNISNNIKKDSKEVLEENSQPTFNTLNEIVVSFLFIILGFIIWEFYIQVINSGYYAYIFNYNTYSILYFFNYALIGIVIGFLYNAHYPKNNNTKNLLIISISTILLTMYYNELVVFGITYTINIVLFTMIIFIFTYAGKYIQKRAKIKI